MHTPEEMTQWGRWIGERLTQGEVLALYGGLGVGKTTLVRGIAEALHVQEPVTSPTYTIINEYEGDMPIYHIDAYRLRGSDDAFSIGIEDYLYGNGICIIEWAERIQEVLPVEAISVDISIIGETDRLLTLTHPRFMV
ncbi:MAG TPA: tRNA (adenosine(37)-N6)-threonylcarbamoyltransferase complex ATPase subunit type 1 TsaE [Termitinemataceae bacterium]|nr:tRNA (adenosine(37)-N6)-threonylcarbamoyltransferase complex ATPase subunit type 1 TsaE [Termitinemataceae bacterium]HOM23574.1 tRNA (adenosine(37)-N6)-threonylcarbamoyltransferase complex ATPase subunit type 1 TsaE [Termitinemataceae bacterium]HPP99845.1 tRNA (adenosine(37)-N6)-threonylcarbamoyltransferase complex ATPase subunit type 1 TsaE [Termitinemataceae bacterium]